MIDRKHPASRDRAREEPPLRRHSYLLRLFQEEPGCPWQFSLQEDGADQPHSFPDLFHLHEFLRGQTGPSGRLDTDANTDPVERPGAER